MQNTIAELLDIACSLAIEAGELVLSLRREGVSVANTKASSIDVVTHADHASEAYVKDRLTRLRPDDGFFGEENTRSQGSSGLTWIVDPIDGTVNYLYGIPHYSVSIAVVEGTADPEQWNQLAGAVYNPVSGDLFYAAKGLGAWHKHNDELTQLGVNQESQLSESLFATGFAYTSDIRAEQAGVLNRVLPRVRDLRRGGTASLDLCYVAAGKLDGYFERDIKPWDYAAGTLIVREAGGTVCGFDGKPEGRDMLIATNAVLAEQIEKLLR